MGEAEIGKMLMQALGNSPILVMGLVLVRWLVKREEKNSLDAAAREARMADALDKTGLYIRTELMTALTNNTQAMGRLSDAIEDNKCRAHEARTSLTPSDLTLQRS